MPRTTLSAVALAAASIALLVGCSATPPVASPTPTPDAFDVAWDRCVWSHPEPYEAKAEDGEGYVMQTPEEGCERWVDQVGEDGFIDQWDEEYAQMTRCAFVLGTTNDEYADEIDACIEAAP